MTAIGSSLWITLIGMGLVFIAILLLWALMEAVVRLTSRSKKEISKEAAEASPEPQPAPEVEKGLKARAAAAAVAYAMAKKNKSSLQPAASGASGSAWQAVTRSIQLNNRGQMTARKSRGK